MTEIRIDGKALDLTPDFSIDIEDTNPIYNDIGSQSIPVTVPATLRNLRILGFPTRLDTSVDPNNPERDATVCCGAYIRHGKLNVSSADRKEGISINIGFDNSTAYNTWSNKRLCDLGKLPVITPDDTYQPPLTSLLEDMYRLYTSANPQKDDLAIFTIAVSKGTSNDNVTYSFMNVCGERGFEGSTSYKATIDGKETIVSVPPAYRVSPFLRVWRIIELIFADMDIAIISNPFKEDIELARLVVLNNVADAICPGTLKYADLMPDCTVAEFLNALWVRFGLVYNINYSNATVSLSLIRDIIKSPVKTNIQEYTAGFASVIYEQRQYVKLSAKTSVEGAEPACERFEDFTKNMDVSNVRLGASVRSWTYNGNPTHGKWDGDVRSDWGEFDTPDPDSPDPLDPDFPDYDDDRDDDPDYKTDPDSPDYDDVDDGRAYQALSRANTDSYDMDAPDLAREFITSSWFKLDSINGTVIESSSSFFNWDPQPENHTALDLSSDDECIPIIRSNGVPSGYCPAYLFDMRHNHTYIRMSDGNRQEDDKGNTTPLAFMIAFTMNNETIGRFSPETDNGALLTMDDGSTPSLSLLFQFRDGLFARFWKEYDEILRHGNRIAEVDTCMPKNVLQNMDVLSPVSVSNIRCLVDSATYSLPADSYVPVSLKLRTISTQGYYDIDHEQNIPDISITLHSLKYMAKSSSFDSVINLMSNRSAAAADFIRNTGYQPHGVQGDAYYVDAAGAIPVSIRPTGLKPNEDLLPRPYRAGQTLDRTYSAILRYDIHEIHDMQENQWDPVDFELSETPIGTTEIEAEYRVRFISQYMES